jgi:hypothetical protein
MMVRIFLLISFFGLATFSFGQKKNVVIQQRIEFIAEELETEDISLEDVFDLLYYYYDNPLNLNDASREDLQELMLLSDFQINELIAVREEKGPYSTVYELKDLKYWDISTLENVLPFVVVQPLGEDKTGRWKEFIKEGKLEAYFRYQRVLEDKDGYEDVSDSIREESNSYYWGSPDKLYSRIRYTHKRDLSVGVTMEKDPGEQLFGEKQPNGFDFYSAHAYYSGKGLVRKVALGDFQVEVGQALTFWTGYAFNKTVDASNIRKNARGLRPYASVDETRFMRGAGVELGLKRFSLTTWASSKGVDGSIDFADTLNDEQERVASSINLSGYHRTTSEVARKNSLQETVFGSNFKYEYRGFQVGVSAIQQRFDSPYQRDDQLRNKYEFSGDELTSLSADYSYIRRNISVFGEVAQSRSSNSVAFLQGVVMAIGDRASLSALYRNYPKDYHTFYARAFGESSRPINESGLYFGGNFELNENWDLNTYVDFFKSPWLRFRVDTPSEGHEVLGQLKYRPSTDLELFVRVREQTKMQNSRNSDGNIRPVEETTQRAYRLSGRFRLNGGWQLKSRIDYVTDQRESMGFQQGFSVSQDLLYRSRKFPLELTLRYAVFDTDSYDVRIYSYEYNLQNVFSIPVYFNEGSRGYILLRYTFWKERCDLWLRYAAFVFDQEGSLSSGPERIEGNVRSEFGAQLRIKL